MYEMPIEWEIHVEFDIYGNVSPYILNPQNEWIPQHVRDWMVGDVIGHYEPHPDERWPMIEYTTMRTITYEVEVRYTEVAGVKTAKSATCQTEFIPNFVKGWIESQAMTEFNNNPLPEVRKTA